MNTRNLIAVGITALVAFATFAEPKVTDVVAKQRYPWNGKVDITYTLIGDVSELWPDSLWVTAYNRKDGVTYTAVSSALSGDTGVRAGQHHVVWDLDAQGLEFKSDDVVFTIGYLMMMPYCVIDLSAGADAESYPVTYLADAPTNGFNSNWYKTRQLVLRLVKPGTFRMCGQYTTTLTKPYYCGIFEVTQRQYDLVMGSNPCSSEYGKGDTYPVYSVSYDAIRGYEYVMGSDYTSLPSATRPSSNSFIGKLRARTGLDFDLPTEAQWEYACRAGTTTKYYWGASTDDQWGSPNDVRYCWYYTGSFSTMSHVVGGTIPNDWGFYDMSGNVEEWCLDQFEALTDGMTDPSYPPMGFGLSRVYRGGSWVSSLGRCSSGFRDHNLSFEGFYDCGFRLGGTLSATAESTPVAIDSRAGVANRRADAVPWDASWIGGRANATVVIADNGTEVKRASGTGEFSLSIGRHELTYTTYIWDVAQAECYSSIVYRCNCPLNRGDVLLVDTEVKPTCTKNGWMHEVKCRRCNAVMVEAYDFVPALGHAGSITKPAVAPTSSEPGLTAEITCTRCGKVLQSQTVIPALGYIRNITARQLWPHKKVEICYEVADDIGDAARSALQPTITVRYGSTTTTATSSCVYGDTACSPGIHRVVWDFEGQSIAINQSSVTFTVSYASASGASGAVAVNTSSSVRDNMSVGGTVNLGYSPFADGEVKMQIDGELALSATNSGVFAWQPLTLGSHVVKHISGGYEWTRVVNVTELAGEAPSSPNPPAEDPNISITPMTATFGTDGGAGEFTVLAGTQSVWNVRSNVDWISVTVEGTGNGEQGTAGIGEQRVLFNVAPFNEVDTRSGVIMAAGKTFTVNQTGRRMKLNKNSAEYDCSDHVVHVEVNALSSTKWSVAVDANWMSIVDAGSGKGTGSVTLAMDENLSYNARTGTVEIGTEMFTVTQLGRSLDKLSFDIAPVNVIASVAGTNGAIAVDATLDLPWSATSDADWLSIHADTATGSGSGRILYSVSPNPTYKRRIGTIVVTPESASGVAARSFTVTQMPQQLITNLFVGTDGVAIAWNNPSWAVTYRVYRGTTDSLSSATVLVELPNDGNCTYLDASGNADYCYWIEAEGPLGKAISDPMYPYSPITYENLRGATNPNPTMYQKGTIISFVAPGAVTGYTFAGWTPQRITVGMSGAQTVRAEWTANRYSIIYDPNGGIGVMDATVATYDRETTIASNGFTRAWCDFIGWATNDTGAVVYAAGQTVSNLTAQANGFVTLYAVWAGFHVDENGVLLTGVGLDGATEIVIPDGVTSIGDFAFRGWSSLTRVTIPNSVTNIGKSAFSGCNNVRDVTVPGHQCGIPFENVTNLVISSGTTNIADGAFSKCSGLKHVTIPDSVASIGLQAFFDCYGLKSVTIPDSVTSIGWAAFSGCSGLTSVTIPDSVTSIGGGAFVDCRGLKSVTIPDSVTSIGDWAFSGCSGLKSVTIGSGVTSIGYRAFSGCWGLTSVTIDSGMASIGWEAFLGCDGIRDATVPGSQCGIPFGNVTNLVISERTPSIGFEAFSGCSRLESVTIPDSVTASIGWAAFSGCSGLKSVTIGNGVTSIEWEAFSGCSGLTNVVIGIGVTSIGYRAFSGCSGLTSVTIPDSVTSIDSYAFYECSGLKSVTISDGVTMDSYIFDGCDNLSETIINVSNLPGWCTNTLNRTLRGHRRLFVGSTEVFDLEIPSGMTNIASYAFRGCSGLKSVTIPDSVTSIGIWAFDGCTGLTSVTIPDSVTSIEAYTFYGCSGLTSVTIPNGVTSIGGAAFYHCSGLKSVTIPDGVTSIGDYAFNECYGLRSVTIPSSVTSIGYWAFHGCSGLTSVTIPQVVCSSGLSTVFQNSPITNVILSDNVKYVSSSAFSGCSRLKSITIPSGVTNIASYAFRGCSGLKSVTIPDSVTSIGGSAFYGCSGLESVTIPDSVTSIGSYAFYGCSGLESVTIPDSVTSIGYKAFYGCSSLTNVTIGTSVASIGESAFSGCSRLTSVHIADIAKWCGITFGGGSANPIYYTQNLYLDGPLIEDLEIPGGVTNIASYAFYGCSGLKSITIPDSVTSIGAYAFKDCNGLECVTIPDGVTSIGESAFECCIWLGTVTIPNSVTNIGLYAFRGCQSLHSFNVADGNKNFSSVNGFLLSKDGKTLVQGVSGYGTRNVIIPEGVTDISSYAFCGHSWLASVTIPDSVTSIGAGAFEYCGLERVTIPSSVTNIESSAFSDCSELTSVYVSSGDAERVKELMSGSGFSISGVKFIEIVHVAFDANGGSVGEQMRSVEKGTAIGMLPTPVRTLHTFSGWWTSASGGSQIDASTEVSSNVTYYAQWTPFQYIVTFDANGGLGGVTNEQDYASAIVAPTVTKEGYTFAGWDPAPPATVPASNVTCTAQWTVNHYTVTFDANGGNGGKSVTQDYGAVLSAPSVRCIGYTFTGWSPSVPSTVPASSVTYTAQWRINRYAVIFNANGGVGGMTNEQDYASAIIAPSVTREGYTFTGWNPAPPATVPASNVTYTAQWTANRYTVTFNANGGNGMMADLPMVYDLATTLLSNVFARTDAWFMGWSAVPGGELVYMDGECVMNLTSVADDVVTLYAVWRMKPVSVLACEEAFGDAGIVTLDENDNVVVTLTNDVRGTVEIPDNVGTVIIDLNGCDIVGDGGLGGAALPDGPAIRIVKGDGEGAVVTQLAIVDTSYGEKGQVVGGGESAGIEIADGAAYGVSLEVDDVVSVLNGDGTEQDCSSLGRGSLPWPDDGAYNPLVANVYDGYVLDGDGALAGIVQIKAAKQAVKSVTDKKTKVKTATTNAAVTATVTDAAGKKWSYSKGVGTVDGVVTGLVCTTKGVLVPSFGVALGADGLEGEWGGFLVAGARNGMGTKGDAMMAALGANYKKSWTVALTNGLGVTHLQLVVGTKGSTKISGITPDGFKISATVQGVMGDNAFFVPYLATLKNGKLTRPANLLLTLGKDGAVDVRTSNLGALKAGGPTTDEIEVLPYAESASSKGGEAYAGAVVLNDLAYPAKFAAKGLPAGLKIDAATGAIMGIPTKPGRYTATITVTSGVNSKKKIKTVVEFDIGNYTDAAIGVEDSYSGYCVGVMANEQITAALGCSVSGLPAGLKFAANETKDKTFGTIPTGTIYGVPTKAGEYTVYFKKSEKVNGKSVNHQASATFKVDALPAWAQGTFNGAVFAGVGWDSTPAGLVQNLSIGANGKISGKLADADGLTWTLSANSYDTYDPATETYSATLVGKSGKLSVTNAMSVVAETVENPNGNDHVRGTATGDDWSAKQDCWKQEPWKTLAKAFAKAPQVTTADGVSIKFAATGTITAKGVFTTGFDAKTGKPIVYSGSCSSVLIPEGGSQYVAFVYFPPVAKKSFGGCAAAIRLVWNGSSFSLLP